MSFTFDFKKLLENALRFVTDVVLNYKRSSCRFKPIIPGKLPKTILCISKSAQISNNLQPQYLCHRVKHVWCLFVFNLDGLKLENEM